MVIVNWIKYYFCNVSQFKYGKDIVAVLRSG